MAADFLLRAGVVFDPKDVDSTKITAAVASAVAKAKVKLSEFSVDAAKLRAEITQALGKMEFNVKVNVQQGKGANNIVTSTNAAAQATKNLAQAQTAAISPAERAMTSWQNAAIGNAALVKTLRQSDIATAAINKQLVQTASTAEMYGAKIGQITTRFGEYFIAIKAILAAQELFHASLQTIFDFDNAIQDLNKVLRTTPEELGNISKSLFDLARTTGQSYKEVANSMNQMVRQGLSAQEALNRTKTTMVAMNISEMNQTQATDFVTSALASYGNELNNSMNALDIISKVADVCATSTDELAAAFIRSGASAKAVGVSFKELEAIEATVISKTRLSATTVGAAFKTVFNTMATGGTALRGYVNNLGAQVTASDDLWKVLKKISLIYPQMNKEMRGQLSMLMGGKRRFTELSSILENFDFAEQLLATSMDSSGVAMEKNQKQMDKLSTMVQNVKTGFAEFITLLGGVTEGAQGAGVLRNFMADILEILKVSTSSLTAFAKLFAGTGATAEFLRSTLVGITKGAFFTIGASILKGMVSGFVQMTRLNDAFAGSLSRVGSAFISNNTTLIETTKILQRIIGLDEQRLGIIRQQAAASKQTTVANTQSGVVVGKMTPEVKAGMLKVAGIMALMAAMQNITDVADRFATKLESSNEEFDKMSGATIKMMTSAANVGVMFGVLAGKTAGVAATLATLGVSLWAAMTDWIDATKAGNDALLLIEENAIDMKKAAQWGEYGEKVFKDRVVKEQKYLPLLDFINNTLKSMGNELSGLPATLNNAKKGFEQVSNEVAGIIRSHDLKLEYEKFTKQFKDKTFEFEAKFNAGDVGDELDPIITALGKFQSSLVDVSDIWGKSLSESAKMALAQQAINDAENQYGMTLEENLTTKQLLSETTKKLLQDSKVELNVIEKRGEALDKELKSAEAFKKKFAELQEILNPKLEASKQKGIWAPENVDQLNEVRKQFADMQKQEQVVNESITKLTEERNKLDSQALTLQKQKTVAVEDDWSKVKAMVNDWRTLVAEIDQGVIALKKKTLEMEKQLPILQMEAKYRAEEAKRSLESASGKFGAKVEKKVRDLQHNIDKQVADRNKNELNGISALEKIRKRANDEGRIDDVKSIDTQIEKYKKAMSENRAAITEKLVVEAIPELSETATQDVKDNLRALAEEQINGIQLALEHEKILSNQRIKFIEEYGKTVEGQEVIQKHLGNITQWAGKAYGRLGARIVEENSKIASLSVDAIMAELDTLDRGGVGSEERLSKYIEARSKVTQTAEEDISMRREYLLKRVEEKVGLVEQAEQKLIDARNKIPELNQRVMDTQEALAQAEADRQVAEYELMNAYQAAADAQADYLYNIQKSVYDVKIATGSIAGLQTKINELAGIYTNVNSQIIVSEKKRLEFQKQIADEMLSVYQQQYDTLKNIGVEAATATADELANIQESLAVASQIVSGKGAPSNFSPEQLSGALKFKDLMPGLEKRIAEVGMAKLGFDPKVFDSLEQQMVNLATISAQSSKQEVMAANQSVMAAQQSLMKQDEAVKYAQNQVDLAIAQRDAQLQIVASQWSNYQVASMALSEQQRIATTEIDLMNRGLSSSVNIETKLDQLNAGILKLIDEVNNANVNNKEVLSSIDLYNSKVAPTVPNSAKGSLSQAEFRSLAYAARREKMAMPPGSKLMMANTSETVLNRRQANTLGLHAIPRTFAADGNAAVNNNATVLGNAINALLTKLNSPGFVQQFVNVSVDTERKVAVTGLDAIDQTVRSALEQKFGTMATKEEQNAINDAVLSIVSKLQEVGIVNSMGR